MVDQLSKIFGWAPIAILLLVTNISFAYAVEDSFGGSCLGGKECLKKSVWTDRYIAKNDQLKIQDHSVLRGMAAAWIGVDADFEHDCKVEDVDGVSRRVCLQKTELRERFWRRYAIPGWYGFSFRLEGEIRERKPERFIFAQWKRQDSGGSPFLALRFDNGVFHITLQDDHLTDEMDECRVLVAKAPGDFDAELKTFAANEDNAPCMWTDYAGRIKSNVKVSGPNGGSPSLLPDPCAGWVDAVLFVEASETGNGEIRIYAAANRFASPSDLIAIAKGRIRASGSGNRQYFKFGIYRDVIPDFGILPFALYFDEYRRGDNPDDVFVDEPPEVASLEFSKLDIPTRECGVRPRDG